MPLRLVHGPPNSGRAGRIRSGLGAVLDRDPVLVVPTVDDVDTFERELCAEGAVLGAAVMTFGGLFAKVAASGGSPAAPLLSPAQRLGTVAAAVADCRSELGPLRGSSLRPGFPAALERLLDELQGAGLEPSDVAAGAATLEGSAYLGDISTLFAGYARIRDRLGRVDAHGVARVAIALLADGDASWWVRPVFVYGFDDLTPNQLNLLRELAERVEVSVALPYEPGNPVLEARTERLLEELEKIGVSSREALQPNPDNTPEAPLLFHLERGFGNPTPRRRPLDGSLVFLRSAGERGEAEAIGLEVARLLAVGVGPEDIAIVLRDPARRGPLLASVLEAYGVPTALEAELPVARTSVGGCLGALLEALLGTGRSAELLRYMRGPSAVSSNRVDWFERHLRRRRVQSAATALAIWEERFGELPGDVARVRRAAGRPAELAAEVGALAIAMGARAGSELEARAAAAIATAMVERAELDGLAPVPEALGAALAGISVRIWSGPVEDRVRIADPYRVRAARFQFVFVGSLQDGEFPRGSGSGTDPFLSEHQRHSLGLPARRESEAEERYLFHACLALPERRLFLSFRDSDENGVAEAPSPLLEEVRRLLEPIEEEEEIGGRGLAEVVHQVGTAPSETELARAIAARGSRADRQRLLEVAGADEAARRRVTARLDAAAQTEATTRAPGPLSNPSVLAALGNVAAYGGTTLEGFDVCSYRWFVTHELAPQPLDPPPDPLLQGGIMHAVLEALYMEGQTASTRPRPDSVRAWISRSRELVAGQASERGIGGHPAERAMLSRIEGLLARFLGEEAARETEFEPWLLEAGFSEEEETERPPLEFNGWRLHGAIDRVDRAPDGRALVIDYKLSSRVTSREKLEEEAKLQLQLYLMALANLWEVETIGGLYHPLGGTSERRPRGIVLDEAAADLSGYRLSRTDKVDGAGFEELLEAARDRATTIVARMRSGQIERDPGPRLGLREHGVCPSYCDFAAICRRDRAPVEPVEAEEDDGER